jgi:nucleoid-associated protein YgaU
MTSDAKVGLLLGLVFIFIIAFIINGLPSFRGTADNNAQINDLLSGQGNRLGLGAEERSTVIELNEPSAPRPPGVVGAPPAGEQARFRMDLPPGAGGQPQVAQIREAMPASPVPAPRQPVRAVWPKTHVVGEGDILASIAQKFYGPEEGNRRINITRIFRANRGVLKSPDNIYTGQRLIIPAPAGQNPAQPADVLSGPMFERRRSVGDILLGRGGSVTASSRQYVVKEGENLWKIAAKQLGDGNRYKEIFRLNADKLANEHEVVAGTSLKLPPR